MAFSERTKKIVKQKACFRCAICHNPFVEIHHIIPREEGGHDTEDNAAPLCAACHDLYGGNPDKRKQIREMRDHWYELMERRYNGEINIFDPIEIQSSAAQMKSQKDIAIYHVVYRHEKFEVSADILFKLLKNAQMQFPNKKRFFYIDIEGHRNHAGGCDEDMFELQKDFALGFLMKFITEIHMPLGCYKNNNQSNEIPDTLKILTETD